MCAVICRNDHCYASRAQKPHFRVKTTKNLEKIAHSDTKMPILCSKGRKMGVPKPKSAQKCRFCARRSTEQHGAARRASQKSTEQLGVARNQYREARRGREQPPETGQDRLERSATARSTTKRNRHATQRNRSVTHNATATATPRNRHAMAQQKRRQPFGLSPLKIGGYLLSHMVVQYHRRK